MRQRTLLQNNRKLSHTLRHGQTAVSGRTVWVEVVIRAIDDDALDIVRAKKNLRLLITGGLADPKADGLTVKSLAGGLLVQSRDNRNVDDTEFRVVTKKQPTEAEMRDILEAAVRPANRLRIGSALSSLSREAGLTNADLEALDRGRDRTPAKPMSFE